jgi:hypothetical protein
MLDLWSQIEAMTGSAAPKPPPPPPVWETTAQIFIVHRQECLCGRAVEFADCSGRLMIERRRRTDGAIHIHELPEGTIPQCLPRKIWIETHRTAWCPQCLGESNPCQPALNLGDPT